MNTTKTKEIATTVTIIAGIAYGVKAVAESQKAGSVIRSAYDKILGKE